MLASEEVLCFTYNCALIVRQGVEHIVLQDFVSFVEDKLKKHCASN